MRILIITLAAFIIIGCSKTNEVSKTSEISETSGTKGLPDDRVAILTASETIGFRNYNNLRISHISIDGELYALNKNPIQFRLMPGDHEISVAIEPNYRGAFPARSRCFTALPANHYDFVAFYSDSGLTYQVRDASDKVVSHAPTSQPVTQPGTLPGSQGNN